MANEPRAQPPLEGNAVRSNEKLEMNRKMREEGEALYMSVVSSSRKEDVPRKRWLFVKPGADDEVTMFTVEDKATPQEMLGRLQRTELLAGSDVAAALMAALKARGRAVGAAETRRSNDAGFNWVFDMNMESSPFFFTRSIPEWGEPGRYRALLAADTASGAIQVTVSDSDLGAPAFTTPFIFVKAGDTFLGDNIADCMAMFELAAKLNKLSVTQLKSVYEFVVSCAEGLRSMDLGDEPYYDQETLEWHRISRIVQYPPAKKPASKRDLVREIARMASGLHFEELARPHSNAGA
jgi:hypothetical protein